MMNQPEINFFNFLFYHQIPFAFGIQELTCKNILTLIISDYIYYQIYMPKFCNKLNHNHENYIYKNNQLNVVFQKLNRFHMFYIIAPYHYINDLNSYIKKNRKKDTQIFVVKNNVIFQLPKFNPKTMYALLSN